MVVSIYMHPYFPNIGVQPQLIGLLLSGEKKTGVTIMEMDEGLDTGDILKVKEITIGDEDDSQSIHDKLSLVGVG